MHQITQLHDASIRVHRGCDIILVGITYMAALPLEHHSHRRPYQLERHTKLRPRNKTGELRGQAAPKSPPCH